jgi:lysophospholipid acyltransferase (LPLAT)-like uncharacterized protein
MSADSKPFRLPWHKRLLLQPWAQTGITLLVSVLLRALMLTYRTRTHIAQGAAPYMKGEKQAVFCFWHGQMILLPFFKPKNRKMYVLISHHRDGELITRMIGWFGLDAVRGSGSRGVRTAVAGMQEKLAAGENVAVTPDGPRGPIYKASRGAVHLAQHAGVPMLPVSVAAARKKQLRSWDRFMIPQPFSKVVVQVGAPLIAGTETEKARLELETTLNQLTQEADDACRS